MQSPAVANVGSRIASQVKAIAVKDGQTVNAGDLLIELDDSMLRAALAKDQALLLKDKASAADAEVELSRAKQLLAKQAGTQQAYDTALAVQRAAEELVSADQAQVDSDTEQLQFARITAPISGRLGEIGVSVGDLVGSASAQQQSGLLTITQMQPLKVRFRLPERALPDVRNALSAGRAVEVRLHRSGTDETIGNGTVTFIDSAIDVASGTVAMSAVVDNAALNLWPGEFVNIDIQYGTLPNAISIPSVAVQLGQKGTYVWLVKSDGTVEERLVTVSRYESGSAAVSTGLAEGDNVVVEGQMQLKDGARVSIYHTGS